MIRAVYMSRPTWRTKKEIFEDIVIDITTKSQIKNRRLGLTGALIVHPDWFIQVLEGEKPSLMRVLNTILCDPRHEDLRIFEVTSVPERMFGDWAMHSGRLSDLEPRMVWECIDGFNRYGPARTNVLIQALTASAMLSAA